MKLNFKLLISMRKLVSCEYLCRVKFEEIFDIFSRINEDRIFIMKFLWYDIKDWLFVIIGYFFSLFYDVCYWCIFI